MITQDAKAKTYVRMAYRKLFALIWGVTRNIIFAETREARVQGKTLIKSRNWREGRVV